MPPLGQPPLTTGIGKRPQSGQRVAAGFVGLTPTSAIPAIRRGHQGSTTGWPARAAAHDPDQTAGEWTLEDDLEQRVVSCLQRTPGVNLTRLRTMVASLNRCVSGASGQRRRHAATDGSATLTRMHLPDCRGIKPSHGSLVALIERLLSQGQIEDDGTGLYRLAATPPPSPASSSHPEPGPAAATADLDASISSRGGFDASSSSHGSGEAGDAGAGHMYARELSPGISDPTSRPGSDLEEPVLELLAKYPAVHLDRLHLALREELSRWVPISHALRLR